MQKETLISYLPFGTGEVHSSPSEALEELAAAFALEALPYDDLDGYRSHLSACDVCRTIVRDFLAVADALPLGLDEPASPPGLKERILAQAELGDVDMRTDEDAKEQGLRPRALRWLSILTPRPRLLVVGLLVLALGLAAWNVSLQLRLNLDAEPDHLPGKELLIEGIAAGGPIIRLSIEPTGGSQTPTPDAIVLFGTR